MSVSKRSFRLTALLSAFVFVFASMACNPNGGGSGTVTLQGAGATFPNPLYQKWLSEYGRLHPNVKIDYQSIGSGGGIKQIKEQTVDFGASDAPMKDEDLKSAPGEILHIPTVLGAVVITYNLEGVSQAASFLARSSRRHLPWQDQEVERSQNCCGQFRRNTSGKGHYGGPSLGRQRHVGSIH